MTKFQWQVVVALCRTVLNSTMLGKPSIVFGDKALLEQAINEAEAKERT